jgi:hypothetical protein
MMLFVVIVVVDVILVFPVVVYRFCLNGEVMETNLLGHVAMSQVCAPFLKKSRVCCSLLLANSSTDFLFVFVEFILVSSFWMLLFYVSRLSRLGPDRQLRQHGWAVLQCNDECLCDFEIRHACL